MAEPALPEAFEDLMPWLDWALETERARTDKRQEASMGEIRAFYDAVLLRLEAIIRYLEDFRDGDMPRRREISTSSHFRSWKSPIWSSYTGAARSSRPVTRCATRHSTERRALVVFWSPHPPRVATVLGADGNTL